MKNALRRANPGDLVVMCVDDSIGVYREAMASAGQRDGATAFADPGEGSRRPRASCGASPRQLSARKAACIRSKSATYARQALPVATSVEERLALANDHDGPAVAEALA